MTTRKLSVSPHLHLRARVAALSRCVSNGERQADDIELLEARRDLAAVMLYRKIERSLAESPPLTREQTAGLIRLIKDF